MSTTVYQPPDTYLLNIVQSLQAQGSSITDFTIGSGARNLLEGAAGVLSSQSLIISQLRTNMFLSTATGSALDDLGTNNFLVPRLQAVAATGQVTISIPGGAPGAIVIPAGWGPLSTVPQPGGASVAVLTLQDADFAMGDTSVTVNAQAVLGGSAGNLAGGTLIVPSNPVSGVQTNGGFAVASGGFTGGYDAETDDAYRYRIPITVQGRVKGTTAAYLAAALGVPGVSSANVLGAGDVRSDSSVLSAWEVEVYFAGSSGLTSAVQSAVSNAAVTDAQPFVGKTGGSPGPADTDRLVLAATVTCLAGTDTGALTTAVIAAAQAAVALPGVGGAQYQSSVILSMLQTLGVISVNTPLTTFNHYGDSGSVDISEPGDTYATLAEGDCTITVDTITP